MRTPLIMAALAVTLLALFNPDREDFLVFVEAESERLLLREMPESPLGRVLSGLGSSLAVEAAGRATDRENYLLFSIHTIDLDGPEALGNEWRFLGIGGQFIEIERPEALENEEAVE